MNITSIILIALTIFFLITAIIVVALTINDNNDNSNKNIQLSHLKTNNNFNVQIGGNYRFLSENIEEEIKGATDAIFSFIKNDVEIPLDIVVMKNPFGDKNIIASAMMNDPSNVFSGGVVFIYNDYKGTLATSYKKIIMHEILHVLGIGTHINWSRADGDLAFGSLMLSRVIITLEKFY